MKRSKKRWLFIILLALLSIFFLFKVRSIISPFIVGIVLAYLLSPVVEPQGRCYSHLYLDNSIVIFNSFLSLTQALLGTWETNLDSPSEDSGNL